MQRPHPLSFCGRDPIFSGLELALATLGKSSGFLWSSILLTAGFYHVEETGVCILRRLCLAVRHAGSGLAPETSGVGHLFSNLSDHDTPCSQEK